ncbi:MAG: 30S ribosome-binding factor RbfA [Gammaproteobacteria bacterium]|nr:30S ribosome-binding factor RbfA [Pseudomonadales bacterium]MCP5347219.1 30S ribosome-binding factor RbfA [Pseudomonadales bacterium]
MSEQSPRLQRVADLIQRELAVLIQLEINDPRVGMVSVTGVDVSRDLGHANVYVSVLNSPGGEAKGAVAESGGDLDKLEIEENIKALNKAAGYLRSLLARRLKLRTTPKLKFHYDGTLRQGNRLSSLIDKALKADRDQHS